MIMDTLKNVLGRDLPQWDALSPLPLAAAAGSCLCNDERGEGRIIYALLSASGFFEYDSWTNGWQQLASPPTLAFGAGTAMCFDPSQGRVWLFGPLSADPWCMCAYYDIATGAWTSVSVSGLGLSAQWGTDAALLHICEGYNPAYAREDELWLLGNAGNSYWRYSKTANSWQSGGTYTGGVGAGHSLIWAFKHADSNILYSIRGAGSASKKSLYLNNLPNWWTWTTIPAAETFGSGSCGCYDPVLNRFILQKNNTGRLLAIDLAASKVIPCGSIPGTQGTAHVGKGIVFAKMPDGGRYIYYRKQSGTEFYRTRLIA